MKESFAFFDENGDGSISTTELTNALRLLGQHPTRKDIDEMMVDAGKEEDGEINFEEFVQLMRKHSKTSDEQRDEFMDAFSVFDKNGDGFISADELQDMMLNIGEKLNADEVQEMLRQADTDGDGQISYREFVDMMLQQ